VGEENNSKQQHVSFADAARFWIKLGFISFGGPAGQIAIMQTECVDKRRWIDQGAFLRGLNYCMLLPGPEAQQLAAYIGWRLHGVKGAIVAGTAFVVPGVFLIVFLAWMAAAHGDNTLIKAAFLGIKPVVMAIVLQALWRIGRRTCNTMAGVIMAVAAFVALYFLGVPFPAVVLGAGVIGIAAARIPSIRFSTGGHGHDWVPEATTKTRSAGGELRRLAKIIVVFAVLWALPVIAVVLLLGSQPFADVARLFTTAAFVTFGGAYAVLPYIADAGVNVYGWMTPGEMINGLALAETTPGPLILVTTYVGYFGGWNGSAEGLSPQAAGFIAALLTTYVTFLPSFLFIIAGAPFVERLQTLAWAKNALEAITAAVVGVILNLTVFLGQAVLIPGGAVDWTAVAAGAVAFGLLASGRISVPWLVVIGAVFGLARVLVF